MSIFHSKILFQNKCNTDFDLMVAEFDPTVGATSSFLNMNPVVTENFDGSYDYDYGAKFSERLEVSVSFVKSDNVGGDFSVEEVRKILSWLTGVKKVSWLDLYHANGRLDYSILGRFTDVKLQKMDHRVVGFRAVFKSVSPWAYSAIQTVTHTFNTALSIDIENKSDDLHSYVYPKVIFQNNGGEYLTIFNDTLGEKLNVKNLLANEVITMDTNQIIHSDNITRVFGDDFNYQWLRFAPGVNRIAFHGSGTITIQYRHPIKIGDGAVNAEDTLPSCTGDFVPGEDENGPLLYAATADWNAPEGAPGHIKNRTHYEEEGIIHKLDNKFLDIEPMTNDEVDALWSEVMSE